MRVCGICRQPPRVHDPMGQIDVPAGRPPGAWPRHAGTYFACSACIAKIDPSRPDLSALPCAPMPVQGTMGDERAYYLNNNYCGVCRRYAREGADMGEVELRQGDVADVAPGVYMICPECVTLLRPIVYERWKREGVLRPDRNGNYLPMEALGKSLV